MNNQKKSEVSEKRDRVLLKIVEIFKAEDDDSYTAFDFMLDRMLREKLKLPQKNIGKAPYDFIEL